MLRRLVLSAAMMLVSSQQIASGNSLTYDFTGTLNKPINGTTTFNGSFSINPHPLVQAGITSITEGGNDVSLTMNIGNWNLIYVNSPAPDATLSASVVEGSSASGDPGESLVNLSLVGGIKEAGYVVFEINFSSPGGVAQLSNLEDLSLPLNTSSVSILTNIYDFSDLPTVQFESATGTITSIKLAVIPEPSGLAVFAILGMTVMVYQRWHKS